MHHVSGGRRLLMCTLIVSHRASCGRMALESDGGGNSRRLHRRSFLDLRGFTLFGTIVRCDDGCVRPHHGTDVTSSWNGRGVIMERTWRAEILQHNKRFSTHRVVVVRPHNTANTASSLRGPTKSQLSGEKERIVSHRSRVSDYRIWNV